LESLTISSRAELHNGVMMPRLGFGAAEIASTVREQVTIVRYAIDAGYRLIDTAAIYHTERGVGEAIRESGIPRDDFFLSTKVWNGDARRGKKAILKSFEESLRRLHTDYVDLLIFHWPVQGRLVETWRVMEDLYYAGKVRSLGLSNVKRYHHLEIMQNCDLLPHVQQDEFNPTCMNQYVRCFCAHHDIHFEAFSPLTRGTILRMEPIREIAEGHGKSTAQIVLRWNLQHGVTTIPRSSNRSHIFSNADLFDFSLSKEEMRRIDALNTEDAHNWDPENFNF